MDREARLTEGLKALMDVGHNMRCGERIDETCDCLEKAQEIARAALDDVQVNEVLCGG